MTNILLLASKSQSRQRLLKDSQINFRIISQEADENSFAWNLPLEDLVKKIAILKMECVQLPMGKYEDEKCFVLTADTLGINSENEICGKPKDKEDAIKMLKSYRGGATTGTAYCLERKIWQKNKWNTDFRIVDFVFANYIFDVPSNWIEKYFELSLKSGINFMEVSGAIAVEDFGAQFLKVVSGSYTSIIGLPMFELRESLSEMKFFEI